MYTMVLMMAMSTSGDTATFGKRGGGCSGEVVVAGCNGGCEGSGRKHKLFGGRERGGLFGKHKKGCTAAPEPVCCEAPAPTCCEAPAPAPEPTCCGAPAVVVAPAAVATPPVAMPDPKPEEKKAE